MIGQKAFTHKLITYFYALMSILVIAILIFLYSTRMWQIEQKLQGTTIGEITRFYDIAQQEKNDTNTIKKRILMELDTQLKWEWEYERFNRSQSQAATYLSFFLDILILSMTILMLTNKEVGNGMLSISRARLNLLIFLVALKLVLATYSSIEGFEFKQRANDLRARDLLTIRIALEIDMINNETAWESFRDIYKISAHEDLIRKFDRNRFAK